MNFTNWAILLELRKKFLDTVEMAYVLGKNDDKALLATSNGKVYAVGENIYGCLGVGNHSSCGLPTEMKLSKRGIRELVYGNDNSEKIFLVALLDSGEIFWWGSLPFPNNSTTITPVKINISSKIRVKTVACGALHCAVLSDDGKVFTCGRNDAGQLGHKAVLKDGTDGFPGTSTLSRVGDIIEDQTIIDVSCGYDFTVVLLDNGRVVAWGSNDFGQLGICSKGGSSPTPVEVASLSTYYESVITKIVCGKHHVMALSETGTLYVWGSNSNGQIGIPNIPARKMGCPVEVVVSYLSVTDIAASYLCNVSAVQCKNGKFYCWGESQMGSSVATPTEAVRYKSIDDVFSFWAKPKIMVRPMRRLENSREKFSKLEVTQEMTLLETLKNEFNHPDSSDMTIVVDQKKIYVHQYILKTRSNYFNVLISRWLEENKGVLEIKEKSFAAIEAYLKYLYTDKVEADLNLAVELLQLADEYGDNNLKSLSQNIILREIKSDGAADIFADTRKIENCKNLNRVSLEVALRNAKELINSPGFERWDLDTMKDFVREYVKIKGNCL